MGKASKRKHAAPQKSAPQKTAPPKSKTRLWQSLFALVVLGGLALTYLGLYRPAAPADQPGPGNPTPGRPSTTASPVQNQMVLPATPRTPRPATLDPAQFSDPETMTAYQVAKAIPEVLEQLPCYCGCYQSVGHRNNLDCFADDHGVT